MRILFFIEYRNRIINNVFSIKGYITIKKKIIRQFIFY